MIPPMLVALAMAAAPAPRPALTVVFPDKANPSFYHAMSCRGEVTRRTRLRIGKDGRPVPGSGRIAVRCDGPMTTTIEHNPLEPEYFRDTDWSWSFEGVGGRAVMAGSGAKVMRPVARRELRLYVREGYLDP